MTDLQAGVHADLRARMVDLLQTVEPAGLDQPAPATPAWRVRDVVAHMVGVSDDVVSGRLDGIASDPWTAAQVERRRDMPFAELLGEWDDFGPRFEQMLAGAPELIAGQAVFDAFTHEHDIRHALARPGARDSAALEVSWEWWFATNAQAPAIGFVTERGEEVMGTGAAATSVGASRFELLRAVTGRRTAAEIAAFEWEPLCEPGMIVLTPQFTMRTESLRE